MNAANEKRTAVVELTADEVNYLLACGSALLQNIPEKSLQAYCDFDKDQIIAFANKIHKMAQEAGLR